MDFRPSPATLFLFLLSGRESFDRPLSGDFALEAERFAELADLYSAPGNEFCNTCFKNPS